VIFGVVAAGEYEPLFIEEAEGLGSELLMDNELRVGIKVSSIGEL